MTDDGIPDLEDIQKAEDRIGPYVNRTPIMTSGTLDGMALGRLFFRCENLQRRDHSSSEEPRTVPFPSHRRR